MCDSTTKKAEAKVYLFALHMTDTLSEMNAHDQLYSALNDMNGDWYQPKGDESRRIQFIQKPGVLVCRSNTEPKQIAFEEHLLEVNNGNKIKLKVRLPAMRRLTQNGSTRMKPIKSEDKDEYYSAILGRNGMSVSAIAWEEEPESTIFFIKNKVKVAIPVDDVAVCVQITDAKAFIDAIRLGVGRYKTYGCGMLNITHIEG